MDFALKQLYVRDTVVKLQLWDICGQDRFGAIARVYYKGAFGAVLVYDLTRDATFETIAKWKAEIDSKVLLPNGTPLPVVLLANKSDLKNEAIDGVSIPSLRLSPVKLTYRSIYQEALDAYCKEHGFVGWFETSAKLNTNIDEALNLLVEKVTMRLALFFVSERLNPPFPS